MKTYQWWVDIPGEPTAREKQQETVLISHGRTLSYKKIIIIL